MQRIKWIIGGAVVAFLATAGLQSQSIIDVHPGKVEIQDATTSALTVTGGAVFGGQVTLNGSVVMNSQTIYMQDPSPVIRLFESDVAAEHKQWRMIANSGEFRLETLNDAASVAGSVFTVTRTGNQPNFITFHSSATFNGSTITQGNVQISNVVPFFRMTETDQASNEQNWVWRAQDTTLELRAYDGALSGSSAAMAIVRGSGTTINSINVYARLLGNAGTVTSPGFSLYNDPDTGIYSPAQNSIAISTGGVQAARWASDGTLTNAGTVQADDGSATNPGLGFQGVSDTGFFRTTDAGTNRISAVFGGSPRIHFYDVNTSGDPTLIGASINIPSAALGNGSGAVIALGRNTNGAPGSVWMVDSNAVTRVIWGDSTGVLRINSTAPTVVTGDTIGTVVGSQSSRLSTKNIIREWSNPSPALDVILNTRVVDFTYKSGAYPGTEFTGIVADWSPVFSMDNGKSFNPVSAFGYTVLSIQALHDEIEDLKQRVSELDGQ